MAMYEPAYLPPNAEEQDFIQAYENVREKYKGTKTEQRPGQQTCCGRERRKVTKERQRRLKLQTKQEGGKTIEASTFTTFTVIILHKETRE
ncbi:hypothetical protein GBF38_014542 [Nibea albiflora]|uniref:Uncharacterized protein n=1 Tax=Nibea albiflora TaxID=240163 RepID=A0ACB7F733_NIBAL|nr:hypothetical protein GBF38_014542 [Nibea albiflora]